MNGIPSLTLICFGAALWRVTVLGVMGACIAVYDLALPKVRRELHGHVSVATNEAQPTVAADLCQLRCLVR